MDTNQERIMVTNGECIPFLERIMQIQPYPIIYAPVAVLEIQICHIVSTRRILENVISIVKANKNISNTDLNNVNNELLTLLNEQQNDLERLNETFDMNCGIEVEANDLIILLNERIIHETNQIKELLQYNDKMKFDKWLKQKHLEIRVNSWICERKLLPISPNFEIVNNFEANEVILNENDILIINEQIESFD